MARHVSFTAFPIVLVELEKIKLPMRSNKASLLSRLHPGAGSIAS